MSERDDLLPQLPPPNLVGHRTSDGYDTYRDADFTPDLTWSYPFAEQRGYVALLLDLWVRFGLGGRVGGCRVRAGRGR